MLIQKFGGTSVASPQRMRELAKITLQYTNNPGIIVLSAVAGTTNKLVKLNELLCLNFISEANHHINSLEQEYSAFINDLFPTATYKQKAIEILHESFELLRSYSTQCFSLDNEKVILAQGEILSTKIYHLYLNSIGVEATLINALDFIKTDKNGEPDLSAIRTALNKIIDQVDHKYIITQGYICRNHEGKIDNLQRGGSDYTATLIGAALYAEEVMIWTDIDGMHNNDPRIIDDTSPVRNISYREAAELAFFGAKILHPTCIIPTENENIPVRLKYTFDPNAPGTFISSQSSGTSVTAIAAKDNITYIRIISDRMLNAYGFLRKVFEVFEKYETSIDMVTTSEVAVSMSIDNTKNLDHIINEISEYGKISFEKNQSIVCVVGDKLAHEIGISGKILSCLTEVPINMISYGGSENNLSLLINSVYKNLTLQSLHRHLFSEKILIDA
jgi:aspartate kinase